MSRKWVGFRVSHLLMEVGWVPHHLAQLPSRFCQIPICPGIIGQTVKTLKIQVNPTQVPRYTSILDTLNTCHRIQMQSQAIFQAKIVSL